MTLLLWSVQAFSGTSELGPVQSKMLVCYFGEQVSKIRSVRKDAGFFKVTPAMKNAPSVMTSVLIIDHLEEKRVGFPVFSQLYDKNNENNQPINQYFLEEFEKEKLLPDCYLGPVEGWETLGKAGFN